MKSWSKLKNILCVRLDNMGDVLMTTPAIRALKNSVQGRRITLLTSSSGAAITPYIPEIDETIIWNVPWMKQSDNLANDIGKLTEMLKKYSFDGAVIHNVYSQNPLPAALLTYMSLIPHRVAYCRENPYHLLTDWVPDPEPITQIRHEVQRQLDLVAHTGASTVNERMSFSIPSNDFHNINKKLKASGIKGDRPMIVMHIGASEEKRRYSSKVFSEVANELISRGFTVIFTGSQTELSYVNKVTQKISGAHNYAGILSLGELAALISESTILISNNTGPVHIASAVRTPVVVLYALTNMQHTPWMISSKVLYFDVPEYLQSKNMFTFRSSIPTPPVTAETVVKAVEQLYLSYSFRGMRV